MTISRDNYEVFFLDYLEGNLHAEMHEELQLFLQNNPDLAAELDEMKLFHEQHDFDIANDELIYDDKKSLKKSENTAQEDLIDELLAKELEGDLNKDEKALLEKLALGSSLVEKWRSVYALTKLKSSNEIFADKDAVRIPATIDHSSIHELLIAHCEGDLTAEENLMLESLLASDQALRTELSLFSLMRIKPEQISFPAKASLYRKETPVISLRRIYYGVAAAASVALLIGVINYNDTSSALTATAHTPKVEMKSQPNTSIENVELAEENNIAKDVSTSPSKQIVKDYSNPTSSTEQVDVAQENRKQDGKKIEEEKKNISPIESIQSIEVQNLATLTPKGLEYNMPEMKKVYEEPIHRPVATQESVTLLAYLGKAASSRIMGTDAYAYTEKQLDLLSQRVNRNFKFERTPLESKDELLLKVGRFEIQKRIARKEKKDEKTFWKKVKEMWQEHESK